MEIIEILLYSISEIDFVFAIMLCLIFVRFKLIVSKILLMQKHKISQTQIKK